MMRLSEMHFILAEYYASIKNFEQAAYYLKQVREGRNCKGDVSLGIVDMATFKARLLGEVRREFFQEGQTFFYFNRFPIQMEVQNCPNCGRNRKIMVC